MAESAIEISVVIPVYRSAGTLRVLAERLHRALAGVTPHYEIIFVDDGSGDDSWAVIGELHRESPRHVTAVQLMRNFGQHNALMCGFRHARGRYVITMDDDLQNPPEEIPKLVEAIRREPLDVVYGQYVTKQHLAWRNAGSSLVNWFYRLVFRMPVTVTAFRIIDRRLVEQVLSYDLNFTFVDGLLAWNTQRIGQTPVEHQPRQQGRTGYSMSKLATLAFNLFTNFSLLPLQFVSLLGLGVAVFGLLVGVYYVLAYVLGKIEVPGYASTIVAILVLGGVQLLALGIIGEYLGRLHLNVNRKPQYAERHVLVARDSDTVE